MKHILTLRNVTLRFGEKTVLDDFNLTLPAGTHTVLMGPSGCGKTSVLKLAAGLLRPDAGEVLLGDAPAGTKNPLRVSVQFQEPRLLPWLTAAENICAVLPDGKRAMPQVKELLELFGLADAADLYPSALSGGMAQRVALCRALAAPSHLLLLDEPFRGLDTDTKEKIMTLVWDIIRETRVPQEPPGSPSKSLLLVTHDEEEARRFSPSPIRMS